MVLALTCAVQNYDWGVVGDSEVSSLGEANAGVASDATKPHAELWMGTHPSGPSVVVGTGAGLKETIASDARAHLGERVLERFGPDLPFLTKVLSVAKALSIQAHPDKKLAAKLHASNPAAYKDDNHKPEMTLAVTPFEALCGFVCHNDMAKNLTEVPELAAVAGEAAEDFLGYMPNSVGWVPAASRRRIKGVFAAVMRAEKPEIEHAVETLQKRLSAADPATLRDVDALALRLCEQYPKDVGVLCAYLLNYVKLEPDECIYLAANEPHAYLAGTCIECMATSDNVVRAGLTPKLRDVDVLVEMLTYASFTLVPIRPRRRGERRSLRTFSSVSLRPPLAFNPRHRRLQLQLTPLNSTPTSRCMERPSGTRAARRRFCAATSWTRRRGGTSLRSTSSSSRRSIWGRTTSTTSRYRRARACISSARAAGR